MAEKIPENALDIVNKPALAHLATLMPNEVPQVTPVWFDYDGTYIRINTGKGRRKEKNMEERPQVGLDVVDPDNPFHLKSELREPLTPCRSSFHTLVYQACVTKSLRMPGTNHTFTGSASPNNSQTFPQFPCVPPPHN